eukprot:TRINITY_DN26679_c0_g1_i8.p1 TRINITY_DN26679_c0_g1~~TRINITY_DN26679_c0_g1_i8.p1  ORF type:complete len:110 (+),score=14.77 TRINITY_DN26679_c0_g1_i8:107-436(+)
MNYCDVEPFQIDILLSSSRYTAKGQWPGIHFDSPGAAMCDFTRDAEDVNKTTWTDVVNSWVDRLPTWVTVCGEFTEIMPPRVHHGISVVNRAVPGGAHLFSAHVFNSKF